jgi:hypothetical protein
MTIWALVSISELSPRGIKLIVSQLIASCCGKPVSVHYCVHNSRPTVPILIQFKPAHALPSSFFRIHFITLSSHLCLELPINSFLQISLSKPCMHVFSPTRTTYTNHFTTLDVIIHIMFDEEHKSRRFSACSLLQSLVNFLPLSLKILHQRPRLEHPQPTFFPCFDGTSIIKFSLNEQPCLKFVVIF